MGPTFIFYLLYEVLLQYVSTLAVSATDKQKRYRCVIEFVQSAQVFLFYIERFIAEGKLYLSKRCFHYFTKHLSI